MEVNIVQITCSSGEDGAVFGLGEDNKVYVWKYMSSRWVLLGPNE